jgi:hypothetical protein
MQDVLAKELEDTNIGGNTRKQSWRTVLGRGYGPVVKAYYGNEQQQSSLS